MLKKTFEVLTSFLTFYQRTPNAKHQYIALIMFSFFLWLSIPNLYFFSFGTDKRPDWRNYRYKFTDHGKMDRWSEGRKEEVTNLHLSPYTISRLTLHVFTRKKDIRAFNKFKMLKRKRQILFQCILLLKSLPGNVD